MGGATVSGAVWRARGCTARIGPLLRRPYLCVRACALYYAVYARRVYFQPSLPLPSSSAFRVDNDAVEDDAVEDDAAARTAGEEEEEGDETRRTTSSHRFRPGPPSTLR